MVYHILIRPAYNSQWPRFIMSFVYLSVAVASLHAVTDTTVTDTTVTDTTVTDTTVTDTAVTDTAVTDSISKKSKTQKMGPAYNNQIIINTEPEGAVVEVDGARYGTSPVTLENIEPGTHTLIFKKPGHFVKKAKLSVKKEMQRSFTVSLTKPASLSLHTDPSGALISVNGTRSGRSPWESTTLKPGSLSVQIVKQGYETKNIDLQLDAGQKKQLEITLTSTSDATPQSTTAASKDTVSEINNPLKKKSVVLAVFSVFTATILLIEYLGP